MCTIISSTEANGGNKDSGHRIVSVKIEHVFLTLRRGKLQKFVTMCQILPCAQRKLVVQQPSWVSGSQGPRFVPHSRGSHAVLHKKHLGCQTSCCPLMWQNAYLVLVIKIPYPWYSWVGSL